MDAGERLTLTTATATGDVYARDAYRTGAALPATPFTSCGPPHLVLVTCGGAFAAATHHYEDNVVVFAIPVRSVKRLAPEGAGAHAALARADAGRVGGLRLAMELAAEAIAEAADATPEGAEAAR